MEMIVGFLFVCTVKQRMLYCHHRLKVNNFSQASTSSEQLTMLRNTEKYDTAANAKLKDID